MISTVVFITLSSSFFVYAQQVGTQVAEIHPRLSWEKCTAGTCQTQTQGAIVLDANFRPTHSTSTTASCYTGNTWNATLCPDGTTCAMNCALEGVDYYGSFGVASGGNSLALKLLTISEGIRNVGSRVYLLADDSHYEIFHLLNQEFTFDVDVSQLPCGLNGALYFSQMDADGGYRLPTNTAGPKYGTGYCDAQCPRNLRFVNGVANSEGWTSSSGEGNMGTCCSEMDIWEANSVSAAYTPHPCQLSQQTTCNGTACGGSTNQYGSPCDPDGCDFNSFRMGDTSFYGKDLTVDTSRPFTVVTQFLTSDNTSTGTLSEIRRLYIQNGQVIQNSNTNIPGMPAYDSITEAFCDAQKTIFGSPMSFQKQGGVTQMGAGLAAGMVLVMSLWDDSGAHMLWLDSDYPANASTSQPGVARGTCATSSGVPSVIESQTPNAHVVFSNIKFGDIGSTWECRNE